jgi:hypothetical protein
MMIITIPRKMSIDCTRFLTAVSWFIPALLKGLYNVQLFPVTAYDIRIGGNNPACSASWRIRRAKKKSYHPPAANDSCTIRRDSYRNE